MIGILLSVFAGRHEEAEPYLARALLQGAGILCNTVVSYVPLFCARGDLASAREIVRWGLELMQGIRKENSSGFPDKIGAELLALLAHTQLFSGEREAAEQSLRQAAALARRFDAAPDYGLGAFRFAAIPETASTYDYLGATAAESVAAVIRLMGSRALAELWKEVSKDE